MIFKSKAPKSSPPALVSVAEPVIAPWRPAHDQICAEAEAIWRLKGCPGGADNAIWLEAEQDLLHRRTLARDKRDQVALADPRFAFNADQDDMMTELNERFSERSAKEPTSL